jgi:hypothetical protein
MLKLIEPTIWCEPGDSHVVFACPRVPVGLPSNPSSRAGRLTQCDRCGAVVFRWDAYDGVSTRILNESQRRGGSLVGSIDRCHECCLQVDEERKRE